MEVCAWRTRLPKARRARGLPPAPLFASEPSPGRRPARKPGATFFERQPRPLEGAAHGGGGDLRAAFLLEELAVLGEEGEVRVGPRLGGQPLLQRLPLARGRPGGIGSAPTSPVSRRFLSQRLTVAGDTPKVPTTSPRGIPRSTAAKTLSPRSFGYAFMLAVSHQPNVHASRCRWPRAGLQGASS